ncbi:MAG: NAD-dependent epimerase/dehydratase family protein [Acidobacteria bacterium]|nr:NAD-dependent epimerase/dehydratase family protein [Acidobacteriota bacterium]MYF13527.1 NAD-dependent epimerase/dehydratase family protein [Acidobacteriota bacterium]MYI97473.1 NAD-dependent epimerase/dehydratase family protein [Acidobacteriota bacterium]
MILITGGAGFIGSALALERAAAGERVRVLDDFSTGRRDRVSGNPLIDVREGDIRDSAAVREALAGVNRVAHLAALASVPRAELDPEAAARVNVDGTLVVLDESRRAGVSALVYASSCSVYGDAGERPIAESAPLKPRSVYAVTKLAGERHVLLHHRTGGPPAVALRFFNVYGPGQPADSPYSGVLARFSAQALAGERSEIHGDGGQTRDFVFVADVVDALVLALQGASGEPGGHVFNVGTGHSASVREIWRLVADAAGASPAPTFGPVRAGDMRHAAADTREAAELLGFRARVPLQEGISTLLRSTRGNPADASPVRGF